MEFETKIRIIERIKADVEKETEVKSQKKYAKQLRGELKLPSTFSQSSVSRILGESGFAIRDGRIVEKNGPYQKDMELFLKKASMGFRKISETFLFLSIGNEYSFRAKKNIKGLFGPFILSILNDDDGNLIIIAKDSASIDNIDNFLSKTIKLNLI